MLRHFFYFPKADRRAIIALACIAVGCIAVLIGIDYLKPENEEEMLTERHEQTAKAAQNPEKKDQWKGKETSPAGEVRTATSHRAQPVALRRFDPNTVDSTTLIGFGLKPWQVRTLLNYRRAGGKFRTPESISKIYGWSAEDVERLTPYVHIADTFRATQMPREHTASYRPAQHNDRDTTQRERRDYGTTNYQDAPEKFRTLTVIDPNTADSATLRRVPGIGIHIARSIIQYRERLGGFHHIEQLCEIKIFSPELLCWFKIDSTDLKRTHINTASFQQLNSHPYISYEQTRAILRYIRLYGSIQDTVQLKNTHIFSKDEMERLKPYLAF